MGTVLDAAIGWDDDELGRGVPGTGVSESSLKVE